MAGITNVLNCVKNTKLNLSEIQEPSINELQTHNFKLGAHDVDDNVKALKRKLNETREKLRQEKIKSTNAEENQKKLVIELEKEKKLREAYEKNMQKMQEDIKDLKFEWDQLSPGIHSFGNQIEEAFTRLGQTKSQMAEKGVTSELNSTQDKDKDGNWWINAKLENHSKEEMMGKCRANRSYVLLYNEKHRLESTKKWIDNYSYFNRLLKVVRSKKNETTQFVLNKTVEEVEPTIYFFKEQKIINENLLEDLHIQYAYLGHQAAEDFGVSSLSEELEYISKYSNHSSLMNWLKIFEDKGVISLNSLIPNMGSSFVLVIEKVDNNEKQVDEDKKNNLTLFNRFVNKKADVNENYYILGKSLLSEVETVALSIHRYQNNISVTGDYLAYRNKSKKANKVMPRETTLQTGSLESYEDPDELRNHIKALRNLGARYLKIEDENNVNFGDRFVLLLGVSEGKQSTESKIENFKTFQHNLENRSYEDNFLVVELTTFQDSPSCRQTISFQDNINKNISVTREKTLREMKYDRSIERPPSEREGQKLKTDGWKENVSTAAVHTNPSQRLAEQERQSKISRSMSSNSYYNENESTSGRNLVERRSSIRNTGLDSESENKVPSLKNNGQEDTVRADPVGNNRSQRPADNQSKVIKSVSSNNHYKDNESTGGRDLVERRPSILKTALGSEREFKEVADFSQMSKPTSSSLKMETVEQIDLENWMKDVLKQGVHYVGSKDEVRYRDGILLFIEKGGAYQSVEDQQLNLNLFLECLDAKLNNSQIEFTILEIKENSNWTTSISIHQYHNRQCVTKNLLIDQSKVSRKVNLISCNKTFEAVRNPPSQRALFNVSCPCDKISKETTLSWKCCLCLYEVYSGFDSYLYCKCGRFPMVNCLFLCHKEKHGRIYLAYKLESDLERISRSLKPGRSLNILLLGETGVGKSTLVNAFANYTSFQTLPEAEEATLKALIPTSFLVTNTDYEGHRIIFGSSRNETFGEGQSSTQSCKSYKFVYETNEVTLIDTPGIGDTRGVEQDSKNFEQTLAYLAKFDNIDAICILLKPNVSRLSVVFSYCVERLLNQLHKSASRNIIFLFTNCRSTSYRPGDSLPLLKSLLGKSKNDIVVDKNTMYCFDNEAFRFLVAFNQQIRFTIEEKKNFSGSWEKSVEELKRFLKYVTNLPPHVMKDSLTVNGTRNMISKLVKPLCEVLHNLVTNIVVLEKHKTKIENALKSRMKKSEVNFIPVVELEVTETSNPRTVCTNSTCIAVIKFGATETVHYKTICHSPCSVVGANPNVTRNSELETCSAMDNGKCRICSCSWEHHMHMRYGVRQVEKILDGDSSRKEGIHTTLRSIEQTMEKHWREKIGLIMTFAKFSTFLENNSIVSYPDAFSEYLDYLIKIEEDLSYYNPEKKIVALQLKLALQMYTQKKKELEEDLRKNVVSATLGNTPENINEVISQLKTLEISGPIITRMLSIIENSQNASISPLIDGCVESN